MKDLLDILEEHAWLEHMHSQGLLNEKGLLKLRKMDRMIQNMALVAQEVEHGESK